MQFYEYHVHPEVDMENVLSKLEILGWKGVCFVCRSVDDIEKYKNLLKSFKTHMDVSFGYKIETENPKNVVKIAKSVRKKVEIILVHGGKLDINRVACETPEIDILTHPELGRQDGGIDYVMANLAKENNVAIEFNFRNLLLSYKKRRAEIFSYMLENAKIVKKVKAPFVITSGALEAYDLRSPYDLLSFAKTLGFSQKDAKLALSNNIIEENRRRLSGKWIMPGVEKE
jgi:ribonuclease P/MRP protein subunit RPP1